jgi:hypothetical protein
MEHVADVFRTFEPKSYEYRSSITQRAMSLVSNFSHHLNNVQIIINFYAK